MGHVARLLEEAGITTVIIAVAAFRDRLLAMQVPRLVLTPHLMGRPLGAPGARKEQGMVLQTALDLLESASAVGTAITISGHYRP